MAAHPDGTGTGWTAAEAVDVDQPHGLDYRFVVHVAKAVRKRVNKEHEDFGDVTTGGEHTPGYCQVLRQVDGTADVSAAADNTLFQVNGLVLSYGNESLWCISGTGTDPTIAIIHPNTQYKGGDITWTGAAEFDASVDISGPLQVDGTLIVGGAMEVSDSLIDGTLTVYDQADVSSLTATGAIHLDGTVNVNSTTDFSSDVTVTVAGQLACTGETAIVGDVTDDMQCASSATIALADCTSAAPYNDGTSHIYEASSDLIVSWDITTGVGNWKMLYLMDASDSAGTAIARAYSNYGPAQGLIPKGKFYRFAWDTLSSANTVAEYFVAQAFGT